MSEKLQRRRWMRWSLVLAALVLAAQAIRLPHPGPQLPGDGPWTDHLEVSTAVEATIRRACFDCHSAETRWPWYAQVAPVSWFIVHDVRHGRSNLDFSHWSTAPDVEPTPTQRLRWICEETRDERMPPAAYRLMHPEGRVTEAEKAVICEWTAEALAGLSGSGAP